MFDRIIKLTVITTLMAVILFLLPSCAGNDDPIKPAKTASSTAVAPATQLQTPVGGGGMGGGYEQQPTSLNLSMQSQFSSYSPPVIKVKVINQDPSGSGKYAFEPAELLFSAGDKVEFTLKSETEFHTFTVDDLGIDEALAAGEEKVFMFTFNKIGKYDLVCLSHPQMIGSIEVK